MKTNASPCVLTPNYVQRLHLANHACRSLRLGGYRIVECDVVMGDALTPSLIVVAGGRAGFAPSLPGVRVVRAVGGVPTPTLGSACAAPQGGVAGLGRPGASRPEGC